MSHYAVACRCLPTSIRAARARLQEAPGHRLSVNKSALFVYEDVFSHEREQPLMCVRNTCPIRITLVPDRQIHKAAYSHRWDAQFSPAHPHMRRHTSQTNAEHK